MLLAGSWDNDGYHFFVKITFFFEYSFKFLEWINWIPQWCGHCSGGKSCEETIWQKIYLINHSHLLMHCIQNVTSDFTAKTSSGLCVNDLALPTCLWTLVQLQSSSVPLYWVPRRCQIEPAFLSSGYHWYKISNSLNSDSSSCFEKLVSASLLSPMCLLAPSSGIWYHVPVWYLAFECVFKEWMN